MNLTRLIVKGGVISPGELKNIVEMCLENGIGSFSFGSRQDIIFPKDFLIHNTIENKNLKFIFPDQIKTDNNIVSSYVSTDIFKNTPWLTGNKFLYILELFKEKTALKVNITDPKQQLVPLFTGNVNFIASDYEDYWYLYLKLPDWESMQLYPVLVYSWDLAKVYYLIENSLEEMPDSAELIFQIINDASDCNNRTIDKSLNLPFYPFPYYEGMNSLGIDKYWLGLYWRNNLYDLDFLREMCELCFDCKIGKICITPWKSFIIKGIPKDRKLDWEKFLGKRGINVRHSLLELNWHLPVNTDWALKLKTFLVRTLDQYDISTYGLTFGIYESQESTHYFTSIVIQKNDVPSVLENIKIRETYNVLIAENFDPNTRGYDVYTQDIDKLELPSILIELSKKYFEQLGTDVSIHQQKQIEQTKTQKMEQVFQCQECFTIYDPVHGDLSQGYAPDTLFEDLPSGYLCPVCDAEKESFVKIENL